MCKATRVAGYSASGAQPHVLAACQLAAGARPGHEPVGYEVLMAVAEAERWVSVTCSCGSTTTLDWQPPTYLAGLVSAWTASGCAS